MKSVMIVFNQANTERVEYMLDQLHITGFTFFEQVQGRGTNGGEPRRGTHTWPEMNSAVITVVNDEQVPDLLSTVKNSTTATRKSACAHSFGTSRRPCNKRFATYKNRGERTRAPLFFC